MSKDGSIKIRFTESRLAFKRWYDKELGRWMAEIEAEELDALVDEVEKLRGLMEEALPQLDHFADGLSYFPERSERVRLLANRIREALGEE